MPHNIHIEREFELGLEHLGSQWFENSTGADLDVGDVVVFDTSDSEAKSVITTTTAKDPLTVGVCQTRAIDGKRVKVAYSGVIEEVKVDGTTDIVAGTTWLTSHTVAGVAAAAATNATQGVFALALEGYTTNDSLGVIRAFLVKTTVAGGYTDAEVDARIATHTSDVDAHHAKYTDAEAITAVEGEATLDLAGDVTIAATKSLATDTINEKTTAAGVTIDSVVLKDGLVDGVDVAARDHAKYTDAEAISAVEGEATLTLASGATVGGSPVVVDSDIGSSVQSYDVNLDQIAALTPTDSNLLVGNGSAWVLESGATLRTSIGVDAAGVDNSTDVTLAGSYNYFTISGQEITLGQVDLATDVTGDLPVAEGGTGASDAATARTNLGVDTAGAATGVHLDSTPASDHTWEAITADFQLGGTVGQFKAVYMVSDGDVEHADADAATTMPVIALSTEAGVATDTDPFVLQGFVRDDSWAWTVGGEIYASTTAGDLTQTKPSGTGDQVQILGYAVTADVIYFNPSPILIEV